MTEPKAKKIVSPHAPKRPIAARPKTAPAPHAPVMKAERVEAVKEATSRYFTGVGRRKEAVVRVKMVLTSFKTEIIVNGKPCKEYFRYHDYARIALSSLDATQTAARFSIYAQAHGGGAHGQAVALRLGIAHALVKYDPVLQPHLRALGYFTRDPRAKERKKPGLKRARRAPQWQKR